MYDIIGDIHEHANRLEHLLERMRGGTTMLWVSTLPDRQAIFVSDFLNRGPEQVKTYRLVRSMIDRVAALAVMGSREFNPVFYKMHCPDQTGDYLRPDTVKNRKQHAAFLGQAVKDSPLNEGLITWLGCKHGFNMVK